MQRVRSYKSKTIGGSSSGVLGCQDPFLTQVTRRDGMINALPNLVNTRWRGLVDSEIRSHSACSAKDWRLPAQSFEEADQPNAGPTLIVTLLLSLALWAGIWGIVSSLASTVLR